MDLKAGMRLRSTVSEAEVIVVRAPAEPVDLTAGGQPLVAADGPAAGPADMAPGHEADLQLGKRYVDPEEKTAIELLCTKVGAGALAVDGRLLVVKGAKPLPSSD
jgi:hypothetical protein